MAFGSTIGIVLFCLVCAVALIYNRMDKLRLKVRSAFQSLQLDLQRRYLLVVALPSILELLDPEAVSQIATLVSSCERAGDRCSSALPSVGGPIELRQLSAAEAEFLAELSRVNVWIDSDEKLKSDKRLVDWYSDISTSGNRVAFGKQSYCEAVNNFNAQLAKIPFKWFAAILGFRNAVHFELKVHESQVATDVSFA